MKKYLALLMAALMVVGMFAGCGAAEAKPEAPAETKAPAAAEAAKVEEKPAEKPAETEAAATEAPAAEAVNPVFEAAKKADGSKVRVAFITDTGNIDDHGYNQYTYEGIKIFCELAGAEETYYKPAGDTDQDRLDSMRQAVADGYNIVLAAGFLCGPSIKQAAVENPDTLFLASDVTPGDLKLEEGEEVPENISMMCYKEEQSGYLAGYAAVVEGYKELGFLGGIDVPAVVRFGYGFVQGAEQASADLGYDDVNIKYWYSGTFGPSDEIATKMDAWYVGGTEVVFACGGGIYLSCLDAAEANDGLMIGVDVDQSVLSDSIITSAMKDLVNSTVLALTEACNNGVKWPDAYRGKLITVGAAENCVGLPMATSRFETFDQAKYDELYKGLADGTLVVDNSIDSSVHPVTQHVTVDWQ